ncbi:kinase-like domain-containing protein, partial [Gigaspora rosea]
QSKYKKCAYCNEDNTQPAWCQSCDPDIATRWTSRNKDIDDCMKTFQLRAVRYEDVIEWIPFDRLSKLKKLDVINDIYKRAREPSSTVALKTLASSMKNNNDFLKEFKSLMTCKLNFNKLAIYGITQIRETKEYLIVFQYAYYGKTLTWQTKLEILKDISDELDNIHRYAKYIHANFHSGNILLDKQSYITGLGLSKKTDEKVLEGDIYGVMPYVAPEVLSGEQQFYKQQFTQAADIYGFGVIMSEMTTGF